MTSLPPSEFEEKDKDKNIENQLVKEMQNLNNKNACDTFSCSMVSM